MCRINEYVINEKNESKREVLDFIRQTDPFMLLKKGKWGPCCTYGLDNRSWWVQRLRGCPQFRGRECNGKAREATIVRPWRLFRKNRREMESLFLVKMEDGGTSAEGALKKKLLASAMRPTEKVKL